MSKEICFPDGTVVRGCGLPSRDENRGWREFGLYLDAGWEADCDAILLDWPDYGVPACEADADKAITKAFELARQGRHVEVGCQGGMGRTGTVLACMAVLAGIPADEAVEWVRAEYSPYAVEESEQEQWVLDFAQRTSAKRWEESIEIVEVVEPNDELERIIEALTAPPKSLREAQARDGIPAEPGLYSWWTRRGSIPSVPQCPHPTEPELDLFYVGISPKNERSSQNLRKRVVGNHMRGNTGGSTFRLTLASLLFEEKGWKPIMRDRPLLTFEDNKALSEWQHENLRLNWAVQSEPWTIEGEVISRLQPPLNLAGNKSHPFAATVSAARRRFKEAAVGNGTGA